LPKNIAAIRLGASGSFALETGAPKDETDSNQGKPRAMPVPRKNWRREYREEDVI
jgi:hypothetical protein